MSAKKISSKSEAGNPERSGDRKRGSLDRHHPAVPAGFARWVRLRAGLLVGFLCLLGALTTLVAYLPALDADFYFDDRLNIVEVPALHWQTLSWANLEAARTNSFLPRRWVANLSFALNHLADGLDPFGFHLVNIALHLVTGGILAWTCWLLLLSEAEPRSGRPMSRATASIFAAILFLVHPLQTQAVTYVVQRMAVLATLFGLLAFAFYLLAMRAQTHRRRILYILLFTLSWILALGSKENAVLVLAVVALHQVCFHRGDWRARAARWVSHGSSRGRGATRSVVAVLLLVIVLGIVVLSSFMVDWPGFFSRELRGRDFTAWQRMLTQGRVQLLYLSLLVWPAPSRLNLDHDIVLSESLIDPPLTPVALILWLVVLFVVLQLIRRIPRLGFPIAAYLVLHSIESGPLSLELAFEHRMYLPMAALAWLVAWLLFKTPKPSWSGLGVVVLSLVLAGATHRRNMTWSDPLTFYRDCVAKSPAKPRPHNNLGSFLLQNGRFREAEHEFRRALEIKPAYPEALRGLARAQAALGRIDDAKATLRDAQRVAPQSADAHSDYGNLLLQQGDVEGALAEHRIAVHLEPDRAEPRHNLAVALIRAGELERAGVELEVAQRLNPSLSLSFRPLGDVYSRLGRFDEAVAQYRGALEIEPRNGEIHLSLGTVLGRLGDVDGARSHLEAAVELMPQSSVARNNLGSAYFQLGLVDRAREQYAESLRLDPQNEEARRNLELLDSVR